jgi:hypothetical protein
MDLLALAEADQQKGINIPDKFVFGHEEHVAFQQEKSNRRFLVDPPLTAPR